MKRIKKLICGVVSCAFAASLLGSFTTGVTAADDFTVTIDSKTVEPGDSYTLTMDMENIPSTGINVCDFGISFDSSLVTVDSVELGALADGVTVDENLPDPFAYFIDTNVIDVLYSDVSDTPLKGSGTFLSISGKVKETAADGSEAEFKVVPIDRTSTPGASASNEKVIFGYLADDVQEYSPALVPGTLTIKTTPVTTVTTTAVTTTTTQTQTTIQTEPVTTTSSDSITTTIVTNPVTTTSAQIVTTTIDTQPVTTVSTATKATTAKTTTTTKTTTNVTTSTTVPSTTVPVTTTTTSDKLIGDVNLDGRVTIADMVWLKNYFVKKATFKDAQLEVADINQDNVVNIFDVIRLRRLLLNE